MRALRYINQYYTELCYSVFGTISGMSGTAMAGVKFYQAAVATDEVIRNGNLALGSIGTVLALGSAIFVYNRAIKPMLGREPQEEHYGATLLDTINNAIISKRNSTAKALRDAPAGIEKCIP